MDIKVDPKTALEIIDRHIVLGYENKDTVADDFVGNGEQVSEELLEKWGELKRLWIIDTLEALSGVFVSQAPLYNFRDAHHHLGLARIQGIAGWYGILMRKSES